MSLTLLAALALSAGAATGAGLPVPARYAPQSRGGVTVTVGAKPGHGYPRPARPRSDAGTACFPGHTPGVLVPRFRFKPESPDAQAEGGEHRLEAAFLTHNRVVRVRILTTVNGQPLPRAWEASVRKLFRGFDRDRDGFLNRHELEHVFALPGLREVFGGAFYTHSNGSPPEVAEIDRDGDGRISVDEFLQYYQAALPDLLRPRPLAPPDDNRDAVTEAVLARLDLNRDGKLSEAELRKAEKLLVTLDSDEDECISFSEMVSNGDSRGGIMAGAGMMMEETERKAPVATAGDLFVQANELPGPVYNAILKRYDADGDGFLSGDEIPFDAATAKLLDANGDGKLALAELYRLGKLPPDAVVTLNQAATADKCSVTATGPNGGPLPAGLGQRRTEPNRLVLRVGQQLLDFTAPPANSAGAARRFQSLIDAAFNGRKSVAEAELSGTQNQFLRVVFDAADTDFDGKLTRQELETYFSLQVVAAENALSLSTTVSRPNLFNLLDDNLDGKLSVRELRTAWERLSVLEPEGAKFVTRDVLRPSASFRLSNAVMTGFDGAAPVPVQVPGRAAQADPARGPVWFQKMDRNGDGDVSRAEFLGGAADFAAIDTNGDGLISRAEAEAYQKARAAK